MTSSIMTNEVKMQKKLSLYYYKTPKLAPERF